MRRVVGLFLTLGLAAALCGGCAVVPNPMSDSEASFLADASLVRVTADQEPITGPIDLHEAMARALKYNLDHRVEQMNAALRVKELDLADYSMLPSVVAGSGYSGRNNDSASNSRNIQTGGQSLPFSTSQERQLTTSDVSFSWNILDFGLSYVRAQQAADRFLIAEELRRKVVARLLEDVRTAYWRAVSAEHLMARLQALEARLSRARSNARAASADMQTSPLRSPINERELIEIKRSVQEVQRDLIVAKTQLAALMNVRPGTQFKLAAATIAPGPRLNMTLPDMISMALTRRPEIREVWYQRRINENELNAAMLELLPGLSVYAAGNYDSNDYLYNSNWIGWGAKASWNLLKVVQFPAKRGVLEAQDRQLDTRALAVAMVVITQVHVSRIRYLQYTKELATANDLLQVQRRLITLMRSEAEADRISEQALIREELNTLVAEAKRDIAHAGLQNAYAGLYTSIGQDPYETDIDLGADVRTLAARLKGIWVERGERAPAKSWQTSTRH